MIVFGMKAFGENFPSLEGSFCRAICGQHTRYWDALKHRKALKRGFIDSVW